MKTRPTLILPGFQLELTPMGEFIKGIPTKWIESAETEPVVEYFQAKGFHDYSKKVVKLTPIPRYDKTVLVPDSDFFIKEYKFSFFKDAIAKITPFKEVKTLDLNTLAEFSVMMATQSPLSAYMRGVLFNAGIFIGNFEDFYFLESEDEHGVKAIALAHMTPRSSFVVKFENFSALRDAVQWEASKRW